MEAITAVPDARFEGRKKKSQMHWRHSGQEYTEFT